MLVVSGTDADDASNYVTKSEVIDLANPSKSCQPWADHPTGTRFAAGAFVDSQVILCGGYILGEQLSNGCHLITPESSEAIVSLNVGTSFSAAAEINGRVIVAGGWANGEIKRTELITLNQSLPGPDLPHPFYHHCIIKVENEELFLTGGDGIETG